MIFTTGPYGKLVNNFCQIKVLDFFRVVPKKRIVRVNKSSALIFSNPPRRKKFIFYIANMLLILAVFYGLYLYYPLISAIFKYKLTNTTEKYIVKNTENLSGEYVIQIPKILAYSRVIENVSPFDQAEYDRVLKENVVAQAKGTSVPGSGNGSMIYIFAHSTNNRVGMQRNNATFYLLNELDRGDSIYLNYLDNEFKYQVFEKKVISAKDLSYLNYHNKDKEVLILQTCWPIGTDWNRLVVLAEKV